MVAIPSSFFTVHQGDARWTDRLLQRVSGPTDPLITCTITSPPYGDLKDYGHPDQIGFGQPYDEYLTDARRVFRGVYEHTRDDGSMWVVADSLRRQDPDNRGLWKLEPTPFQLAAEAEEAGWILRDVIIWRKDKTLPWSGKGRLRNAFEYVLFLVKSEDFKYRVDRLRDPAELEEWWVKWPERYNPLGKAPDNVWDIPIPVQGSWGNPLIAHACPFPPELVERLVLLATDPGDVVFDPFAGTGSVVAQANRLGRRGLGFELNPEYVAAYDSLVRPEVEAHAEAPLAAVADRNEWVRDALLNLRALKYPKLIVKTVRDAGHENVAATVVLTKAKTGPPDGRYELIRTRTAFVAEGTDAELEELRQAVKLAADRPPASKMGVGGELDVIRPGDIAGYVGRKTLFPYLEGRTWMAGARVKVVDVPALLADRRSDRHPPVLADVAVREEPRALRREPS